LASNNVQGYREALMMSKAELARKAGLLALGLRISDKDRVFGIRNDASVASVLLAVAENRS
jgi:hypothetical protein